MRGRLDVKNLLGMEDTKKKLFSRGMRVEGWFRRREVECECDYRGVTTKPKQTENEELNAKNQTVVHDSRKRQ